MLQPEVRSARKPWTYAPASALTRGLRLAAISVVSMMLGFASASAHAQDLPLTSTLTMSDVHPLDPARDVARPVLEKDVHTPLPEEYIWTATDTNANAKLVYTFPGIAERTEPHYFRAHFKVGQVPQEATLYLAGPRSVSVWINGQLADRVSSDTGSPLGMHVFATSSREAAAEWR